MPDIRVAIVDDEPLARENLQLLLDEHPEFKVVHTFSGGREAITGLTADPPDLLFLDIQMPGIDGFDVVRALETTGLPALVFVTAYDQYALRAFEAHALDYIVKPVDRDRFNEVLKRAGDLIRQARAGDIANRLAALLADHEKARDSNPVNMPQTQRFAVKDSGAIRFIPVSDIEWIEAAGNYVVLHTAKEQHIHRASLSSVQSQLDPSIFVRIHRSTIVNASYIEEMFPLFHGEFEVVLTRGMRLKMSRRYRKEAGRMLQF